MATLWAIRRRGIRELVDREAAMLGADARAARAIGWRHALLVVAATGATGVTFALKALFDRERPHAVLEFDPSYPSGHTTYATGLFGMLALLLLTRRRWAAALGAAPVVAAMGPSRLLLGVHWTSEVLAGYAVGLAWLLGVLAVGWRWGRAGDGARERAGHTSPTARAEDDRAKNVAGSKRVGRRFVPTIVVLMEILTPSRRVRVA